MIVSSGFGARKLDKKRDYSSRNKEVIDTTTHSGRKHRQTKATMSTKNEMSNNGRLRMDWLKGERIWSVL